MHYIVLDLEFNQAFPFKTGKPTVTVPECPFEIIQIGALKLNEQFQTVDTFNRLIQPQIYPRIHPFVEKITGIHEEMLQGQADFPTVYEAFTAFIGSEDAVLCTWGKDDIKSLFKNILYYDLSVDSLTDKMVDVQGYASVYLHQEAGRSIGLKNAVTALQIPISDAFHDAFSDASYTAEIFRIVRPEKIVPEIFQPLQMTAKKIRARIDTKALFTHFTEKTGRALSEEEQSWIKEAYKLGRVQKYDLKLKKQEKKK